MLDALRSFIDQQDWLDPVGQSLEKYIRSLYSGTPNGKQIQNLLNGVWLGHPLHPMLTDVPVGAWTAGLVLDGVAGMSDAPGLDTAADVVLATGLAAAVPAAASGFTDWMDTYGFESRLGLMHGLVMSSTIILYAGSLVARLAGARATGVALSNTGYALLAAGAYLGGDEVFDIGYPVNHTAFQHGPTEFVAVLDESDLVEGQPARAEANGSPVVVVKQAGEIFALDDVCVHAGCSLAGGTVEERSIICPCHGSQYDLRDGAVTNGPATMPEPAYEVRVTAGKVEVRLKA